MKWVSLAGRRSVLAKKSSGRIYTKKAEGSKAPGLLDLFITGTWSFRRQICPNLYGDTDMKL
ncbi:MAG TPA: hypothetical protein V6D11_28890 [Waterburya sp.]